jgi:hypothetical protein
MDTLRVLRDVRRRNKAGCRMATVLDMTFDVMDRGRITVTLAFVVAAALLPAAWWLFEPKVHVYRHNEAHGGDWCVALHPDITPFRDWAGCCVGKDGCFK